MKYRVQYMRPVFQTIEADSTEQAATIARKAAATVAGCYVLAVVREDAEIVHTDPKGPTTPFKPRGRPNGGGTIGGGQIKLYPEPLCDAIAERKVA